MIVVVLRDDKSVVLNEFMERGAIIVTAPTYCETLTKLTWAIDGNSPR